MKKRNIFIYVFLTILIWTSNVKAEDYSSTWNKLLNSSGELEINSIQPRDESEADTFIYPTVYNTTADNLYLNLESCNSDYTLCNITLNSHDLLNNSFTVDKKVNVKMHYNTINPQIQNKLDSYTKEIANEISTNKKLTGNNYWVKYYYLTDLNLINKDINEVWDSYYSVNNSINYITDLRNQYNNANVNFSLDTRAGCDTPFLNLYYGYLRLSYNNTLVSEVEPFGIKEQNVIYIPSDTVNNSESYINAAKKRIKDYLGKDVVIEVGGKIADFDWTGYDINGEKPSFAMLGDQTKMSEYWYYVTLNNHKYEFVIIADSSKMTTPTFKTTDLNTDITIFSDDANIPLNSIINSKEMEINDKVKNILSNYDIYGFDIKLKKTSSNNLIENGDFDVVIPVPQKLNGKSLTVKYVKEDGTTETYNVIVENGYAKFNTNHFSEYYLVAEKENNSIPNPNTKDNLNLYICLLVCSILGLNFIKKNFKSR